jgi:hypothetical protein
MHSAVDAGCTALGRQLVAQRVLFKLSWSCAAVAVLELKRVCCPDRCALAMAATVAAQVASITE